MEEEKYQALVLEGLAVNLTNEQQSKVLHSKHRKTIIQYLNITSEQSLKIALL